jgi:hypothetical protein
LVEIWQELEWIAGMEEEAVVDQLVEAAIMVSTSVFFSTLHVSFFKILEIRVPLMIHSRLAPLILNLFLNKQLLLILYTTCL